MLIAAGDDLASPFLALTGTACPSWCTEMAHPWEPDGDEWARAHEGVVPSPHTVGFPVTIHCYDGWGGGAVDPCDLVLVLCASGPVVLDAAILRRRLSLVEPDWNSASMRAARAPGERGDAALQHVPGPQLLLEYLVMAPLGGLLLLQLLLEYVLQPTGPH